MAKTVKELLSEGKAASYSTPANPSDRKVKAPATLLFRRTAIRTFPDNHIVALYYSPQLDRYVSIPFGPEGKALTIELSEEENLDEWLAPALAVARAVGGAVAPVIARGAMTAGRAGYRGLSALGRGALNKAKQLVGRGKSANLGQMDVARAGRRARMGKWSKRLGLVGIGAAADQAANSLLGGNNDSHFNKNPEHQFDPNSWKGTISAPQSALAGQSPVTNYRQKQNLNYIWNTQPRAGSQVQESLNKIIESKKSEVISGVKITPTVAKKLVNLHESLNTENKQNFEKMFENADTLRKVINFSLRK